MSDGSFARMAVRRAIANLVDNALRHAGEPIEIETMKAPGGVAVEVRDRGPGIPASEVERMKLPFTRLDDARGGAGGSGLGLAIVERVARATAARSSSCRGRAAAWSPGSP
jgi:two-component system osmolarity sensor histidine kinase EnvZ